MEESGGKIWSEAELRQANKTLEVTGERFVIQRVLDGKLGTYDGRFTLNPTGNPKSFDFYGKVPAEAEIHLREIYELQGDTYQLCYSRSEKRPTAFTLAPEQINLVFRQDRR